MKNRSLFLFSLFLLFAALTFSTPAWADGVDVSRYFKVTATQGSSQVYLYKKGSPVGTDIQYSKNGTDWTALPTSGTDGTVPSGAPTLAEGEYMYVKGDNASGFSSGGTAYYSFRFAGTSNLVSVSGDIMSLIDPTLNEDVIKTIPNNYCFVRLFSGCTTLASAGNLLLLATTVTPYAYQYMFNECTSLVDAPNIKGGTIGKGSFYYMFYNCSSLTKAPDTLYSKVVPTGTYAGDQAYGYMFYGCKSLTKAPVIMAETPRAVKNATETGSSATNCNRNCIYMFYGCSNLKEITCYFEEWYANTYNGYQETYKWVENVNGNSANDCVFWSPATYIYDKKPTRGSTQYIPVTSASTRWIVNAFFDYTFDPNGGTWDGVNDKSIQVRRNYISCPKGQSGYFLDTTININADVKASYKKGDACAFKTYKTDYRFYGWNTDKNATSETATGWAGEANVVASGTVGPSHMTYYAIYEEAEAKKIAFNKNGYGAWNDPTKASQDTVQILSPVSAVPGITRAGYVVKQWNTNSSGEGVDTFKLNTPYYSAKVFYAIWEPTYTFDVNTNGGKWKDGTTANAVKVAATISTRQPAVKTDWAFVRWNTQSDGEGTDLDTTNLPSVPTTYYAIFTPNYHFLKGEGTWANGKATTDSILNAPIEVAPTITRAHHDFLGWFDSSEQEFDPENLPATPTTYHAIWYAHVVYTFRVNGGTWGTATGTKDSLFYSFTANPVATRNGYAFVRWNTEQDGSGTDFDWQHPVGVATTYYAIWSENSYTFRVTTNGGTWKDDGSTQDRVMTTTQIMAMVEPRPVAQHEEHQFIGWNTNGNSSVNNFNKNNLPAVSSTFHAIFMDYFYIQAETDDVDIEYGYAGYGFIIYPNFSVSTDGGETWVTHQFSSQSTKRKFAEGLNTGEKILIRGNNPNGLNESSWSISRYGMFYIDKRVSIGGNLMSLLSEDCSLTAIPSSYCFASIFMGDSIVSAENLTVKCTSVRHGAFENTFKNCRSLVTGPDLSIIPKSEESLFKECFSGCVSLTAASELPVDSLDVDCYSYMYQGCTSLTTAPSNLPATYLPRAAYYAMFQGCTSLVNAPTIHATSWEASSTAAGTGAMAYMFKGCTALRSMDVKFTAWDDRELSTSAYTTYQWMDGTTTDILAGAIFSGPASLASVPQDVSHIQVNWNLILPELIVSEDKTSSELGGYAAKLTITNGATLTLDADYMAKNITVGAGCKLTIPDTRTLVADSIFLLGGDVNGGSYVYSYPEMVVNGKIRTTASTATPIFYDYLLNKAQNYTLALPYDVECKEVRYAANGEPAPFVVRKYDGARRAEKGADGKNWTNLWYKQDPTTAASTTIEAGRGYTVYCSPRKVNGSFETYSRLRFPMHPDFTSNAEQGGKTVQVYGYGCSGGEPTTKGNEAHVGWNLVGNPYLAKFGESWIALRVSEDEIVDYAIIPNNAGTHYTTTVMVDAKLPAFKNFFIQMFDNATITYDINTRIQEISARRAAANEANKKVFVGIALKGAGLEDKMGLAIRNDYTEAYDPYADLTKWQNSDINLSAEVGGNSLSMAAVNMTMAENRIPLTVSVAKATELTFSIHEAWGMNTDELKHLYLLDETTGETIDLLTEDYTYQAKAGETKGRFFLMAEPRHIATDIDALSDDDESDIEKFILNGQLYIRRDGVIYNAQGTRVK